MSVLSRRTFAKVAAGASAPLVRAQSRRPPNVIIVMTDDQGYGDLSCHGNPVLKTPNLDRLHGQSVRFTNFHVDPLCSPTRSALMTGRYAARTGVWATIMGRSLLRREETTLANVFASAGYRTGIFGKWHLGDNYPFRPQERGFGECLVHGGGGVGQTPDFWGNDYFDDTYFRDGRPEAFRGYCTDVFFREALRFIERSRHRPFFLYLATNVPHWPYRAPDAYLQPYRGKAASDDMAAFYGMIANFDENMGRLLRRLDDWNLARDTIVVFLTDNGTAAGIARQTDSGFAGFNAGMRDPKGSPYDGGHRVPCFLRWPGGGLTGGRDIPHLAAHFDLMPTLIELCKLKPPQGILFDGRSLTPMLAGGVLPPSLQERELVVQVQQRQENGRWMMDEPRPWIRSAVLTQQWRLIDGAHLYDIQADPGQQDDRAARHPDVVRRLRGVYEQWWQDVSFRFGEFNPIVLGSPREDPARLTCMDWHGPVVPWNQPMVRELPEANGFWAVEFEREGDYQFTLRHQPAEEEIPLRAAAAEVEVDGRRVSASVPEGARSVTLRMRLPRGPARLQTRLRERGGAERGAFYLDVKWG